jgi:hypothetical protein
MSAMGRKRTYAANVRNGSKADISLGYAAAGSPQMHRAQDPLCVVDAPARCSRPPRHLFSPKINWIGRRLIKAAVEQDGATLFATTDEQLAIGLRGYGIRHLASVLLRQDYPLTECLQWVESGHSANVSNGWKADISQFTTAERIVLPAWRTQAWPE